MLRPAGYYAATVRRDHKVAIVGYSSLNDSYQHSHILVSLDSKITLMTRDLNSSSSERAVQLRFRYNNILRS